MLRIKVIIFAGFFMAVATAHGTSAIRAPQEDWGSARIRSQFLNNFQFKLKSTTQRSKSAYDSRVLLSKVDVNTMLEFGKSDEQTQVLFEDIRNMQYLADPDVTGHLRRITWLYPMDGCFARAEQVSHQLYKQDPLAQFHRVFIFGNLRAKTANNSAGYVTWWYHVAVMVRLQDRAYVFDPSLSIKEPIELSKWVDLMTVKPESVSLAVCSSHTYVPESDCEGSLEYDESAAYGHIKSYLRAERSNLKSMGRNPDVELGNNPPW